MAKLTPKQEALLAYASEADDRYRSAKVNARKRAAEMVEREIAQFAAARDKAVYEAYRGEVPKRQIGMLGLKTTSPNTVADIIARVEENMEFAGVELATKTGILRFQWSERITLQNGFHLWFLSVDGDDHEVTIPDYQDGEPLTHEGYAYLHYGSNWEWVGGKPSEEAQQWTEQNGPSE